MIAIASLLNMQANQQVKDMWDLLDVKCGLATMKLTPLPHFTWQSADEYQPDMLESELPKITARFKSFAVLTAGIGIFTGRVPVLYLALVKTQIMMDIHKCIWDQLAPFGNHVNEYYSPERWVPHITLAIRDIDSQNLACAINDLLDHPFEIDILVDNLAVIYQVGNYDGINMKFIFPSG